VPIRLVAQSNVLGLRPIACLQLPTSQVIYSSKKDGWMDGRTDSFYEVSDCHSGANYSCVVGYVIPDFPKALFYFESSGISFPATEGFNLHTGLVIWLVR
jgi:hypothetical protein